MKAILISAAFLIPALVLANDPAMKGAMSPTDVLNKIHKVSMKGVEHATLAQTNASNEKVKSFGEKMIKDYQKLDKDVSALARERNITLASIAEQESRAAEREAASQMESEGQIGSDTSRTVPDERTTTGGMTPDPSTSPTTTGQGEYEGDPSKPESAQQPGRMEKEKSAEKSAEYEAMKARWDRLATLQGAEFDAEFLTMTAEDAKRYTSIFEANLTKTDKKLDGLLKKAIKTFKDHQKQAEKLQRDVRAS